MTLDSLKRYWRKWNVHRAFNGDKRAMQRLYMLEDPWDLDTPREHFRFRETARIIRERIGDHFGSILEIGCGEGLQTITLASLTDHIVGLDPSSQAISRARNKRIANASLQVGDLASYMPSIESRFDLVLACEVLYYLEDLEQAYGQLNELGEHCLVSYYQGAFERLDKFFAGKQVNSVTVSSSLCNWRIVYWKSGDRRAPAEL